jgi:hypothetical protein
LSTAPRNLIHIDEILAVDTAHAAVRDPAPVHENQRGKITQLQLRAAGSALIVIVGVARPCVTATGKRRNCLAQYFQWIGNDAVLLQLFGIQCNNRNGDGVRICWNQGPRNSDRFQLGTLDFRFVLRLGKRPAANHLE